MSKKDHSGWRAWGEYRKERSRLKDFNEEKLNWKEEEVQETGRVFVIINEWTDITGDTSSEIKGAKWFASEDEAWDALRDIAHSYDEDIDYDDTSFVLEDHDPHMQSEEYRIEELTNGDHNG